MVDSTPPASPYRNLQAFGGSAPVEPNIPQRPAQPDLPPPPGPVERLREAIRASDIDTEELASRAIEAFGDRSTSVVSGSGEVDLKALSRLIAEERSNAVIDDLTTRFGDGASVFVSPTGDVDREGLNTFLQESGREAPRDFRQTSFGGGQVKGYGAQAQASFTQPQNFVTVFA